MTESPDADATYLVGGDGVAWRDTGGEIVVLDVQGSVYFGLNGSASQLWTLLTTGASRQNMVDVLRAGPQVDTAQAEADVDRFLEDLGGYGLLQTWSPLPSAP